MSCSEQHWHSSGTYHLPNCLSTTPKEPENLLGQVLQLVSHGQQLFLKLSLCSTITSWTVSECNWFIILSCRPLFTHHDLWLTSGGVSGWGRQEAPGQHWSGWRLKAVGSLVICQRSGGHSLMRRLFAYAQTWKTHSGFCSPSNIPVWSEADGLKCGWYAPGLPASSSHALCLTSSRGIIRQHTLNTIIVQPGWECGANQ